MTDFDMEAFSQQLLEPLTLTREEGLALHKALIAAVAYADHCKAHGFVGNLQHDTLAERYNKIHWDLLKRIDAAVKALADTGDE